MYNKNNKDPNIDLWRTLQFKVPASKKTVPNEMKKSSVCEIRVKPL